MTIDIKLRDVVESDFTILLEHQRDTVSAHMAASGTKHPNPSELAARWKKSLADASTTQKAIIEAGRLVGFVATFIRDGQLEVT